METQAPMTFDADMATKPTLRDLRKSQNMSQVKLAALLNVSQSTISDVETTGKGIGLEKWLIVSEIFDIDLRNLSR
jgi:transcriptional regulator with XRE-family HTH domain